MMSFRTVVATTAIFTLAGNFLWGATTGKITGRVIEEGTGLPLAGANVVVEGTVYGSAANVEGVYLITNIPAGTYNVAVSMIGYRQTTIRNIKVSVDLTTTQNFELASTVLEGESVVIEAVRPLIQQDITSSRTIQSGEDVLKMPVDNYEGALTTIAGAVVEDGEVHFRGGRPSEIVYLLDKLHHHFII